MKKAHLVLLIVTAILALSSAYSLAAINQVYRIDYEWYSQLNNKYLNGNRDVELDICKLKLNQLNLCMSVIDKPYSPEFEKLKNIFPKEFENNYVLIYCSLGYVNSPEYRLKIVGIAQRSNNVEVRVSINTPGADKNEKVINDRIYFPEDIIRIRKESFSNKGRLLFIFKDQNGNQLKEQYCVIN